jgi:hypothetical protein
VAETEQTCFSIRPALSVDSTGNNMVSPPSLFFTTLTVPMTRNSITLLLILSCQYYVVAVHTLPLAVPSLAMCTSVYSRYLTLAVPMTRNYFPLLLILSWCTELGIGSTNPTLGCAVPVNVYKCIE